MAGLFSLGPHNNKNKKEQHHQGERENTNIEFLFRNQEIYNNSTTTSNNSKGFEIWPQTTTAATAATNYYSFGLGPSRNNNNTENNNGSLNDDVSVSFSDDESTRFGFTVMRSSSSGSGTNCQDCGNQAKKDCVHLRCRTCCRSRGLPCSTHVKSTWVPAAKRRERQHQLTALQQQKQQEDDEEEEEGRRQQQQQEQFRHGGGGGDGNSRRYRDQQQGVGGLELGHFPPELNSPAVFRCVKVSPMDAPDERYAYQTAVNIGGHVFKGILYDQGQDGPYTNTSEGGGEGSSHGGSGGGQAHHQQLNLISATTSGGRDGGGNNPMYDPSQLYPPPPMNAFMSGTQFFPPPRS